MYNVLLFGVFITIVAMETQKCIPLVLLKYLCRFQYFRNNENVKWKHSNEITLLMHYNYSYQNYERHFGINEKCPIFLFDVNQSWDFWADFFKIRQCQIS